jgi:hypothetical protein
MDLLLCKKVILNSKGVKKVFSTSECSETVIPTVRTLQDDRHT